MKLIGNNEIEKIQSDLFENGDFFLGGDKK